MSRQTRRQTLFVCVFLVIVILFVMTFRLAAVRGVSMLPTYQDGQPVLVLRRNWFRPALKQGDVVLVQHGRDVLIKRIYRLPGEEIDGRVTAFLTSSNTYDLSDYYERSPQKNSPVPRLTVPQGYVVVLGDNAPQSEDSRQFGPIPIHDIIGTVVNAPPPPTDAVSAPALRPPQTPRLQVPQDLQRPPHSG